MQSKYSAVIQLDPTLYVMKLSWGVLIVLVHSVWFE